MDCFDHAWFCLDVESADHFVGVVGSQVKVVVDVVLVEQFPHQERILCELDAKEGHLSFFIYNQRVYWLGFVMISF